MNRAQGLVKEHSFLVGVVTSIVGMVAMLAWVEADSAAQHRMAQQAETTVVCAGFWGCGPTKTELLVSMALVFGLIVAIAIVGWVRFGSVTE